MLLLAAHGCSAGDCRRIAALGALGGHYNRAPVPPGVSALLVVYSARSVMHAELLISVGTRLRCAALRWPRAIAITATWRANGSRPPVLPPIFIGRRVSVCVFD